MHWTGAVVFALVAPLLLGGPASAASETVILKDTRFNPKEVTISAGDTVTWRHRDNETPHSVTFEDGFDPYEGCSEPDLLSNCMAEGDTTQRTFLLAGTYRYYCRVHRQSGMSAVVTVVGPAAVGSTTTSTARSTPSSAAASSSSSSSSTTATTQAVVSTSTTRPPFVAAIPTTTTTAGVAYQPAPQGAAPALNPAAPTDEEETAAPATPGDEDPSAERTAGPAPGDGGGSGGGSAGMLTAGAAIVVAAAGGLAWKFRPKSRTRAV